MILHVKGTVLRANVVLDSGNYEENRHIRVREPFVSAVVMLRVTHIPINDGIEFVPIMEAERTDNFNQLYKASFDSELHGVDEPYMDIIVSALDMKLPKMYSSQCLALMREGDSFKAELSIKETEGLFSEPNNSIIWLNLLPRN